MDKSSIHLQFHSKYLHYNSIDYLSVESSVIVQEQLCVLLQLC